MHHSNSQHMSVNNLLNMMSRNMQHGVNSQSKTSCGRRGKNVKEITYVKERTYVSK